MNRALQAPTSGDAVWQVALECAYRREDRTCKNRFDSPACSNCSFNIRRYAGYVDDSAIELAMIQADTQAYGHRLDKRNRKIVYGIIAVIVIALIIYSVNENKRLDRSLAQVRERGSSSYYQTPTSGTMQFNSDVTKSLERVAADLNKIVDVNGDGLVNCIDAAVLFYKYYPDKNSVCIEANENLKTGMNHLFNCVLINGNWVAIEPQAYWMNRGVIRMHDYWGSKYDVKYNKDETHLYLKYVR